MRHVRRLDLGQLRPPTRRDDGTIRVEAHLTKCGVFPYLQPDGTIRRELRLPEEVTHPQSLQSFAGVPVTNDHPPEMIHAKNAKQYAVGSLQGAPVRDDDHLRGELAVYDSDAIGQMDNGSKRQVSLGYTCDLEENPGHHPVYGPYDAIQRNIRGNHVALVSNARAGSTACVRLDAADRIDYSDDEPRGEDGKWSGGGGGGGGGGEAKSAEAKPAAPKKTKLPTFAKAKEAHLAKLKEMGWDVKTSGPSGALKVPHATSPSGDTRLYFKTQAVHASGVGRGEKHDLNNARSIHNPFTGAPDIRSASTEELVQHANHVASHLRGDSADGVGMGLAHCKICARMQSMATEATPRTDDANKPQGGKTATTDPDPQDLASRNAAGETAAPAKKGKKMPATSDDTDHGDDAASDVEEDVPAMDEYDADDEDDDDDEDEDGDDGEDDDEDEGDDDCDHEDAGDANVLSAADRHKMAASSFAVPEREQLPIHDPEHTQNAMARFGQTKFKSASEKHAAFNRIVRRAKHFGIDSKGFEEKHRDRLDHKDKTMITDENKSAKLSKLRAELAEAQKRNDGLEAELAKAQGQVKSMEKDLQALKDQHEKIRKDAADALDGRVTAKVTLLTDAKATGATVDAKMSDIEIKRAVVKHVDGDDIAPEKPEPYVDALYEGALKRARKDAADTAAGAAALANVRQAAVEGQKPEPKFDAADIDEDAAYQRAATRNAEAWTQSWPRAAQETK